MSGGFYGVGRIGPYERLYKVSNLGSTYDNGTYVDVEKFCRDKGITPTGFVLGPDATTMDQGYTYFDHCPKGNPLNHHDPVPMATFAVHPGALRGYYKGETNAQFVFVVGINP